MLATIFAAVGLPLILTCILVAADMRSDLSDLKPVQAMADPTAALIGWPNLEHYAQGRIRMLGYMMDGYEPSPDGAQVRMFILMPEAGHFLHPAHRIPNEMVEIRLRFPAPFKCRSLVWATGLLALNTDVRDPHKALYAMHDAGVDPAIKRDIARWFRP